MKQMYLLAGLVLAITQAASGATMCTSGTLASYIALGSGGCSIGSGTVGMFQTLSGQNGAVPIDPGDVAVTPSGDSSNPALTFDFNIRTAITLEAIFSYRIFGNSFTGSQIMASNTTTTGDGSVTAIQNLCGAGIFGADGVSGCTGTTLGPLVVVSPDMDQTTFVGVPFLTVTDDFTVDGGPNGFATGGTFVDRFTADVTAVPEPGTILITSLGTAFLITLKQRFSRNRFVQDKEKL